MNHLSKWHSTDINAFSVPGETTAISRGLLAHANHTNDRLVSDRLVVDALVGTHASAIASEPKVNGARVMRFKARSGPARKPSIYVERRFSDAATRLRKAIHASEIAAERGSAAYVNEEPEVIEVEKSEDTGRRRVYDGQTYLNDYVPDSRIIDLWYNGICAGFGGETLTPYGTEIYKLALDFTPHRKELPLEFSRRLAQMLSTLGFRQAHGLADYEHFSVKCHFHYAAQIAIVERFEIIPDQFGLFFELLHADMFRHLHSGHAFSGDWGRLVIRDDELRMVAVRIEDEGGSGKEPLEILTRT